MIAVAEGQLAQGRRLQRDRPEVGAARVGLDHQEGREVVEEHRHRRRHQHLQVRDLQELREQERGRAQRRRGEDGPDAGGGEDRAAGLRRVAGAAEDRPRQGAEGHRGGHAAAGHRAEEEPGDGHAAPGRRRGPRPPHGGERPVDEEPSRARVLEHGAVDGEQHDVGGRDLEGHAEDPVQRHVQRAHQAVGVVAAVADGAQPDEVEQRADVRIDDEERGGRGEDPSRGAPRRLEDEQDRRRPQQRRPSRSGSRSDTETRRGRAIGHPSARPDSATSAQSSGDGRSPRAVPARRIQQERRGEGHQQEARAVQVRVEDRHHPVQAVDRERRSTGRARAIAAGPSKGPRVTDAQDARAPGRSGWRPGGTGWAIPRRRARGRTSLPPGGSRPARRCGRGPRG